MALLVPFEGSTFREYVAQEVENMLKHDVYTESRRNFTFWSYYDYHSMAHGKLLKANKSIITEQKIDLFVQGIQYDTAHNIVVHIAGDPTIQNSFDIYYNAAASRLELSFSLTRRPDNREDSNVNETCTGKHNHDKNSKTDRSCLKKPKNSPKDSTTFIP